MANTDLLATIEKACRVATEDLRVRANDLTGTEVIAEEEFVPRFDAAKDYTGFPVGSPVYEEINGEKQVYKLLQPHNASIYPSDTPASLPALWSICHTTDSTKAKPFMPPNGTSGMYMKDECCKHNGTVYRCKADNNVYSPSEYAENWEVVG
ncbi:MAG: hypothetical protein ACOX7J_00265 [Bacillota bacterium]|jgi:hypothetical protein